MVSLNWSAPLFSSRRYCQPIDELPYPEIDGHRHVRSSKDKLTFVDLEQFRVEPPSFIFQFQLSDVFFLEEATCSNVYSYGPNVNAEDVFDIVAIEEPILKMQLETSLLNDKLNLLNVLEISEDIHDEPCLLKEDLLPVSDSDRNEGFISIVDLDPDDDDHILSMHCLPVIMESKTANLSSMLELPELEVGVIDFGITSSSVFSCAFSIKVCQENRLSRDCCDFVPEPDEESSTEISFKDEPGFLLISSRNPFLVDIMELVESHMSALEFHQTCCSQLVLDSEVHHRLLKYVIVRLQMYNPASPDLLEVPELPSNLMECRDLLKQLQLLPLAVECNMKSIADDRVFAFCTEQDALDGIVREMKASLPKSATCHRNRAENVVEELESEFGEPLMALFAQVSCRTSPSAASCSTRFVPSPVSALQTHGSVRISTPPSVKGAVLLNSKSKRKRIKAKQHTLEEFIALTTLTNPDAKILPKSVNLKEVEIAPSDAILDAFSLFCYAASTCIQNLQMRGYLQSNESLLSVRAESARDLFKRIASRLRQCDQNKTEEFLELCDALQNALVFATLRQLVHVLFHSGITLCLSRLRFELERPDLRTLLFSSRDFEWADALQDLYSRLNLLFGDVCQGQIRDHPKIDALLEHLEPRALIFCNCRSLVNILMIALSVEEDLHLKLGMYEKGEFDYSENVDVVLAFYEDVYRDENFLWASFRKIIFYEEYVPGSGEFLAELIEEGRICCLILRVEENNFETRTSCFRELPRSMPPIPCIIANANMAEQNLDICEGLQSIMGDLNIVWREKSIPDTSFVTSPSSLVVLNAIPSKDEAHSLITWISSLYVQYRTVTLIIIHDVDAVTQPDFIQVQMWLVAGLATSRIGFQCNLVFATTVDGTLQALCQDISMQVPMYNVAAVPSQQEQFLSDFPSINPAAASIMIPSGLSLARLHSASLSELKSWFADVNPISLELFYNLSHMKVVRPLVATPSSLLDSQLLSSGGYRRSPEQSTVSNKRRKLPINNHKLEDYWGPSIRKSSVVSNHRAASGS